MWEDLGADAIASLMDTKGGIDGAKQSMEELTALRMDNITTQMKEIGRQIQTDFLIPIAEELLPVLKDGFAWIGDNLNWLVPTITGLGIALGTYFAVAKFMSFISVVKTLITMVKTGTTVMGALNTVMALNPIALVVAGIVGLIATFVLLWNKCDAFREFWLKLWDKIKEISVKAVDGLKKGLNAFKDWISKLWSSIKDATVKIWDGLKNALSTAWKNIKQTATNDFNQIKNFFSNAWKNIKQTATNDWNQIKNMLSNTWNWIKNTATSVFNACKNFIVNTWNSIKNGISNAVTSAKNTIQNVWNSIRSTTTSVFNACKNSISNVWNAIKTTISNSVTNVKSKVSSVFNSVKSTISSVFNSIKSTASSKWNSIKNAIMNPIETAKNNVKSAINKMKSYFNFSWSLPKPKLPSFSVSGGKAPWGFMGKGSLPKISIKWNKEGAIFTKPTIFDTQHGFEGVGEAGAEAVLPIEKLENWINRGFGNVVNNNYYANEKIDRLIEVAEEILEKPFNTYLNGRKVSEGLASSNDSVNGNRYSLKNRGLVL